MCKVSPRQVWGASGSDGAPESRIVRRTSGLPRGRNGRRRRANAVAREGRGVKTPNDGRRGGSAVCAGESILGLAVRAKGQGRQIYGEPVNR